MKVHIDYIKLPKEHVRRGVVDFEAGDMIITVKRVDGSKEKFCIHEKGEDQ
jgi:hypothetical protein